MPVMRGHVRERSPGRWELRAYIGTDPDTGKERRITRTVAATSRRAAERALTQLLREADNAAGRGPTAPKRKPGRTARQAVTVRDGFDAWWAYASPAMEPNGASRAREWLDRYVHPTLGDVALWRLRPDLLVVEGDPDWDPDLVSLTAWYAELGTSGGKDGRPLAPATVRRVHAIVRSALDYCVSRNWVTVNPAIGARLPVVRKREATVPAAHTLTAFLRFLAADDPDLFVWTHLMNSGARRVDLGLRFSDVDVDLGQVTFGARGVISAKNPATGREETLVRDTPTRKRRLRTVALDDAARAALADHLAYMTGRAAACGVDLVDDPYVFSPELDGSRPYHAKWSTQAFARAKARAAKAGIGGLDQVRLYDIRHFMGTQMLAHGVPIAVVAERMGNSARTMDAFYRHAVPASDRAAAELMAKILGTVPGR